MIIEGSVQKLTIYIGSQDTWQGRNLGAAIIERCRAQGLAGATMTRGNMGFGKNSLIHRAHLLGFRRHAGANRGDRSARTDRGGPADSGRDGRGRIDRGAGRAGRSSTGMTSKTKAESGSDSPVESFRALVAIRNDDGGTSPEGESRRSVGLERSCVTRSCEGLAANRVGGSPRRSILP